jgi:hypothetical protein
VKAGNVRLKEAEATHSGPRPTIRDACADADTGKEISAPLQTSAVKDSFTCAVPLITKLRASVTRLAEASPVTDPKTAGSSPTFVTSYVKSNSMAAQLSALM